MKLLFEAGLPVPKTVFSSLVSVSKDLSNILGFPFVIQSTIGKQGHGVWSPKTKEELQEIVDKLLERELQGERFIFQEFVEAAERHRILVIGGKAMAGIARPTRWRRRFTSRDPEKTALIPIPQEDRKLAEKAADVLGIDIAGVDILVEDKTQKRFVLEVNSAPRWASIKKDTGLNVEKEILKYLKGL
jgi:RimK family alpha-L-glutamate ligase